MPKNKGEPDGFWTVASRRRHGRSRIAYVRSFFFVLFRFRFQKQKRRMSFITSFFVRATCTFPLNIFLPSVAVSVCKSLVSLPYLRGAALTLLMLLRVCVCSLHVFRPRPEYSMFGKTRSRTTRVVCCLLSVTFFCADNKSDSPVCGK